MEVSPTTPLLKWYKCHKRPLPWRRYTAAYPIWISEIMLQQTQVKTVIPYWENWLLRYPNVQTLARAPLDEVLKAWEGLGYYTRARNIHKTANIIAKRGYFPENAQALQKLPGIGPYTAGAIASIAFGQRISAVDGNALRIAARLLGEKDALDIPQTTKALTAKIDAWVPAQAPGDFNQALMDLGATICKANGAPLCESCPLVNSCYAYHENLQGLLPMRLPKKPRRIEKQTLLFLYDENGLYLRKRPKKGLLAGLYEPWRLAEDLSLAQAEAFLQKEGIVYQKSTAFPPAKHLFTHIEWPLKAYAFWIQEHSFHMTSLTKIETKHSLPSAFRFHYELFKALYDETFYKN